MKRLLLVLALGGVSVWLVQLYRCPVWPHWGDPDDSTDVDGDSAVGWRRSAR